MVTPLIFCLTDPSIRPAPVSSPWPERPRRPLDPLLGQSYPPYQQSRLSAYDRPLPLGTEIDAFNYMANYITGRRSNDSSPSAPSILDDLEGAIDGDSQSAETSSDDGSGQELPFLEIPPTLRGIKVHYNHRSIIFLLDTQQARQLSLEQIPADAGVAVKVHRSRKEFVRELRYYLERNGNPSEDMEFYGATQLRNVLPHTDIPPRYSCGLVFERLDHEWLKSMRCVHRLRLGPHNKDVDALSYTMKIKIRMLLWVAASRLPPDHGQINYQDLIVLIQADGHIRAFIIDFGDAAELEVDNFLELYHTLQRARLFEPKNSCDFVVQIFTFFWIEIIFRLFTLPTQAFENIIILLRYVSLLRNIWQALPRSHCRAKLYSFSRAHSRSIPRENWT